MQACVDSVEKSNITRLHVRLVLKEAIKLDILLCSFSGPPGKRCEAGTF
jgi:hypothetical protein